MHYLMGCYVNKLKDFPISKDANKFWNMEGARAAMTSKRDILEIDSIFAQREALMQRVLKEPALANSTALNATLVDLVHKYIDAQDTETQMIYLYYLLGKDFEESAHMLNIPESRALRYFYTFISRFNRFIANQLKQGNIDVDRMYNYIKQLRSPKMDDRQIANLNDENMLTTKIMRHFLTHARVIPQFIVALLTMDSFNLITFINLI